MYGIMYIQVEETKQEIVDMYRRKGDALSA